MDLGERIIDCNNEEHLVGLKINEDNIEYIITIERRFFRKNSEGKYIECLKDNTDKKIYKMLNEIVKLPESFDVIY